MRHERKLRDPGFGALPSLLTDSDEVVSTSWIFPSGVECVSCLFQIHRAIPSTSLVIFPLGTSLLV